MEEKEKKENSYIDLFKIGKECLRHKKLYIKVCAIAAIVGLVVAFSIPKEYTAQIKLAPEFSGSGSLSGSMSSLASMVGVKLGSSGVGDDAITPDLYPDVIGSTKFCVGLFNVKVTSEDGSYTTDYYNYLSKHCKTAWWNYPMMWVRNVYHNLRTSSDKKHRGYKENEINAFYLTEKQYAVAEGISGRLMCDIDKKTYVITLQVTAQDPYIAATMVDSVRTKLQSFITTYRTSKARNDMEYMKKIRSEAQKKYLKTLHVYADYCDANKDIVMVRFKTEEDRLENEMQLAFNVYNQASQQYQLALAKVQESTPAFTEVESATVPIKPIKPNKMLILISFILLAFVGTSGWVLAKHSFQNSNKNVKE